MMRPVLTCILFGAAALAVALPAAARDGDDWRDDDRYEDRDYDRDYRRERDFRRDGFRDDDDDGVRDEDDICPETNLPEDLESELGEDRFAVLNRYGVFDAGEDRYGRYDRRDYDDYRYGDGYRASFTLDDTYGCSCHQIAEALELGRDADRYGCSASAIDEWIDRVEGR